MNYTIATITEPTLNEFFKPWHSKLSEAIKRKATEICDKQGNHFNFKEYDEVGNQEIEAIHEEMTKVIQ
jgi:hypothetical protein